MASSSVSLKAPRLSGCSDWSVCSTSARDSNGRPPVQHEIATVLTAHTKLGQQARPSDPRLADELDQPRLAGGELTQRAIYFS
jgi:hypothetical protein